MRGKHARAGVYNIPERDEELVDVFYSLRGTHSRPSRLARVERIQLPLNLRRDKPTLSMQRWFVLLVCMQGGATGFGRDSRKLPRVDKAASQGWGARTSGESADMAFLLRQGSVGKCRIDLPFTTRNLISVS
jgi:hypothetical protein